MWAPKPSIPGTHIVSQLLWIPAAAVLDCAIVSTEVGERPCGGGTCTFDFGVGRGEGGKR